MNNRWGSFLFSVLILLWPGGILRASCQYFAVPVVPTQNLIQDLADGTVRIDWNGVK